MKRPRKIAPACRSSGSQRSGFALETSRCSGAMRLLIAQALKTGQPVRVEFINYTVEGREFWVDLDMEGLNTGLLPRMVQVVVGDAGAVEYPRAAGYFSNDLIRILTQAECIAVYSGYGDCLALVEGGILCLFVSALL